MWRLFQISLLIVFASLAACTSKNDAAEKFFASGMSWYEQQEWAKARIEFGNAIQKNPKLAEAYYYLALVAKEESNIPMMFENLTIVTKLDPGNFEAAIKLAELQILTKEFQAAIVTADSVLQLEANYYDALRIKAAALLGLRDLSTADAIVEALLAVDAKDASVLSLRSVILREQGQIVEALDYLGKAIEYAENKVQYRLVRVALNKRLGNIAEAEKDMMALVAENPADLNYSYALARHYLEYDELAKAENILTSLIELKPDNAAARKFLVETIMTQDESRAMKQLDEFLVRFPLDYELTLFKIDQLFANKKTKEAEQLLVQLVSHDGMPNSVRLHARVMLAEYYFGEGRDSEAQKLLDANIALDVMHEPTLLVLADRDLQNTDYSAALAKLNSVLRQNPESEKALLLLGQVYLSSGSPLLADDSFRQVLQVNPANPDAAIPVVRTLMLHEDLERSVKVLSNTLKQHPQDVRIQSLLANVLIAKKDWQKADDIIKLIQKNPQQVVYANFLAARLLQGRNYCDSAIEKFTLVLEQKPDMVPALDGLARCYLTLKKAPELLAYIEEYNQKNPTLRHGFVLAAQYYQTQNNLSSAIQQYQQALSVDPAWLRGYAAIAGLKAAQGNVKGAVSSFRKGIAYNKNDAFLKVLLADFFVQQNNIEEAEALYQELLEAAPNFAPAINNYAVMLLDYRDSERDRQRALALAQRLKDSRDANFLDTFGWALYKNGEAAQAEQVLRHAASLAPNVALIHYHQALALQAIERVEEAQQVLHRAMKYVGDDSALKNKIQAAMATKVQKKE